MENGIKFVQPTPSPDGFIGLRCAAKPRYDPGQPSYLTQPWLARVRFLFVEKGPWIWEPLLAESTDTNIINTTQEPSIDPYLPFSILLSSNQFLHNLFKTQPHSKNYPSFLQFFRGNNHIIHWILQISHWLLWFFFLFDVVVWLGLGISLRMLELFKISSKF